MDELEQSSASLASELRAFPYFFPAKLDPFPHLQSTKLPAVACIGPEAASLPHRGNLRGDSRDVVCREAVWWVWMGGRRLALRSSAVLKE